MSPTPGPWLVHDLSGTGRFCVTVRAPAVGPASRPDPAVAKVMTPRSWDEARANARLIAAGPTMYDYIAKKAAEGDADAARIIDSI